MRLIKLALISLVVFYMLIWAITFLFPNVTVLSRAINIAGSKDSVASKIKTNVIPYRVWLTNNNDKVDVHTSDISFYENDLFNAERQPNADTIYFEMVHQKESFLKGGLGLYQLSKDSATAQLFYVFRTKWYKPWEKMAQIANDAKYGGQMDAALSKLKLEAEK
jgi:hypothetical protein